ncbi:hypothetical protein RRG08_008934 [Elysia crispata]|uniref:BTB domain-containing protein n=1 Tax=Elysia crispata TaxID=231223 RepID=A0AAE0YAC6_9GAST|nr:hypothetical protein RRG08_008934 [Elysia crispata]
MLPISPSCVPTGSKIKRVSAIPGRRKSDSVQSSQCNPEPSWEFPVENSSPTSSKSPLLDCEMPPSQTVEDLADLAMEIENATNVTSDLRSIHHEHATDDVTRRKSPISTPLSYGCMLNNSLYSDVSILVAENSCGGQENNRNNSNSNNFRPILIRAHKIILHVQCPQLLDLCDDECINLSNYDEQAVLCVLAFLYSGSGGVWLVPEYREKVFKLAQRFPFDFIAQLKFSHFISYFINSFA